MKDSHRAEESLKCLAGYGVGKGGRAVRGREDCITRLKRGDRRGRKIRTGDLKKLARSEGCRYPDASMERRGVTVF